MLYLPGSNPASSQFTTDEAQFQDPKGCLAVLLHVQTLVSQLERQVSPFPAGWGTMHDP